MHAEFNGGGTFRQRARDGSFGKQVRGRRDGVAAVVSFVGGEMAFKGFL